MITVAQVINQFIVHFRKYCLDVAHGQGASLVNVLGNVIGSDGIAVGYSGVVGSLLVAIGRGGRRVDVKFNGHNQSMFVALHGSEERF